MHFFLNVTPPKGVILGKLFCFQCSNAPKTYSFVVHSIWCPVQFLSATISALCKDLFFANFFRKNIFRVSCTHSIWHSFCFGKTRSRHRSDNYLIFEPKHFNPKILVSKFRRKTILLGKFCPPKLTRQLDLPRLCELFGFWTQFSISLSFSCFSVSVRWVVLSLLSRFL